MFFRRKFSYQRKISPVEIDTDLHCSERVKLLCRSPDVNQRLVGVRELANTCHEVGMADTTGHLVPLIVTLSTDAAAHVRSSLYGVMSDISGFLIQADCILG